MATQPKPSYTVQEYLDLEREAEFKSEYWAGQIYAMSGGTSAHSRFSVRVTSLLTRYLPEQCFVYDSNMRLYVESFDTSIYPDGMAICGEEQFWNGQKDLVTNPFLVVEVLSSSTAKYDRTTKSDYYRSIPSLQHSLLISQDRVSVEWFARQDDRTWTATNYSKESDVLPFQIPVAEIYKRILL